MARPARPSRARPPSAACSAATPSPWAARRSEPTTARTWPRPFRSAFPVSPWRALPPPTTLWPCRRRCRRRSRRRPLRSVGSPSRPARSMTAPRPPWSRTPASSPASSARMPSRSAVRPSDSITPRMSLRRTPSASPASRSVGPTPGTTPLRHLRRWRRRSRPRRSRSRPTPMPASSARRMPSVSMA